VGGTRPPYREGVPLTPSRRAHPPLLDIALAGGLTVALVLVTSRIPIGTGGHRPIDAGGVALIVAAAGSLAFRRVTPLATLAVSTGAVGVYALVDYVGGPVYAAPLVALFTVAALDGRRAALWPAVTVAVVLTAGGLARDWSYPALLIHLLLVSWVVGVVLIGDAVHTRAQQVEALRERARVLEETREEEARRRVAEERLRIARDLHDVVAHSLASISIQAGMGAHVIDRHPDEARAALVAIKAASKEALDELRTTLDVLRDPDQRAPTAPTAGLAALAGLTSGPEQAGLAVTVTVEGLDHRRLPAALDVTAYRIVQESLTNVMRHARAHRVDVRVTAGTDELIIEVVDDGVGGDAGSGAGHGLVGMGERAALVGGRVDAGPRSGGRGFGVHAVLPLPPVRSVDPADPRELHDTTDQAGDSDQTDRVPS
jgi:signal transduction histidine kinase